VSYPGHELFWLSERLTNWLIVVSVPVPDTETTSVVVKRGDLNDIAQTCYSEVSKKCDDISEWYSSNMTNTFVDFAMTDAKIAATVDAKIHADVAADIVADLDVIANLIVKLGADLKAKVNVGVVAVADVRACVGVIVALVKLCTAILVKIKACLDVSVSLKIFANVLVKLQACVPVVVNLFIGICTGAIGGLAQIDVSVVIGLILDLTACLTAYINACLALSL
jgi:hypothetical protein